MRSILALRARARVWLVGIAIVVPPPNWDGLVA